MTVERRISIEQSNFMIFRMMIKFLIRLIDNKWSGNTPALSSLFAVNASISVITEQTPENSNVSAAPTPKTVIKKFSKNWPLRARQGHFKQFSHGIHFTDKLTLKQLTCLVIHEKNSIQSLMKFKKFSFKVSRFVKLHPLMLSWPQSLLELVILITSGPSTVSSSPTLTNGLCKVHKP